MVFDILNVLELIAFIGAVSGVALNAGAEKNSWNGLVWVCLLGLLQASVVALIHPFVRSLVLPVAEYIPAMPPELLRSLNVLIIAGFSVLSARNALSRNKPVEYAALMRHTIEIRGDQMIVGSEAFTFSKEKNLYRFSFYHRSAYEDNVFLRHVKARYAIHLRLNRCANVASFSLAEPALAETLRELRLIPVKHPYILLRGRETVIRKEPFAYTVILRKADAQHLPLDILTKNARILDAGRYRHYQKLRKADLIAWLEQLRTETPALPEP
ncbi:MAG: hypothetical protein LBG73_10670 [Spirochaetaceae bacterium]|jgi:hypothetical protein|nr:hypothetical protein [Spirochaetaceae bacterium]